MQGIKRIIFTLISFVTILSGMFLLEDKKYYLISLILIIYSLVMLLSNFETRNFSTGKLVMIVVLISMAVAGRIGFSFLPQFKPAVAIIIITGVCFGGEIGFMTGAMTGFISNFFFGQGPWTPWQMFCLGLIGLIAGIIFYNKKWNRNIILLSVFAVVSTIIIYGGIMNPISVMMFEPDFNVEMLINSYVVGIGFDIIHALATIVFLVVLAVPMIKIIERIKKKYNII